MSRSVGKDLEHAVNSVVEQLVKRMFEIHERLKQKETDFIKIHDSVVQEMEKNILQNHEKQRFFIDGENGHFELKALQNEKVIFSNNEKMVQVPLNQLDSIVKTIESTKVQSEDMDKVNQLTAQEEIEFSNSKSDQISEWMVMKSAAGYYVGREITGAEGDTMPYDRQSEYFKQFQEAEKVLGEIKHYESTENNEKVSEFVEEFKDKSHDEIDEQIQDIEKANDVTHEASKQLENNVEKLIMDRPYPMLLSSQIRGQLEVINHLKSLSEKEILKSFKDAQNQAKKENKSVEQVYKENLGQRVNAHIHSSKERILDTAMSTYEKNNELRNELRNIETEINKNMGVLYQAKLEQKILPEEYNQLKENLNQQQNQIEVRLLKIDQSDSKINEQLKVDLKEQFAELKTDKLTLHESIGLANAAYGMTNEKTIENLRNFSLENELKGAIHSIDQATKEIELEVKETMEISFSR